MADVWATDGGVFFGHTTDRLTGPDSEDLLCRYVGDRHIVTFGPNGSGKSRRLLLRNLYMLPNWSMLVIDPKGELAERSYLSRERVGTCFFLNPYGLAHCPSHGFNPIAALNPKDDNFVDDAAGLAEAMIRIQGNDTHWSEAAQDLLACLIMYAALHDDASKRNLAFVRECLGKSQPEFAELVYEMRKVGEDKDWDELTVKAGRFLGIDSENNKEVASVLATAVTQTRWLDSRAIKKSLSSGEIPFEEMRRRPITIYLMLPADRLATQSIWLRLIITSCLQKLMRDTYGGSVPMMLMLDEFANIGHLASIDNNQALMRGYGIKLWTVLQDLNQLQAIYKQRWESFIANAGVLQSFAAQDATTAEYLSRLSGQRTGVALSNSGGNLSESQIAQPVMYPQDFRNMDPGFMVIFSHKVKGIVRAFAPYF